MCGWMGMVDGGWVMLTNSGLGKLIVILQTMFSNTFHVSFFIQISLNLIPGSPIDSKSELVELTRWGWVMDICVSKLTSIGSDNGLSPNRHQAII